ncbi:MAG: YicC family protein [Candidatus Omnitrophica bacterium]|nr:YicC family protein [Candidatus Omnitrophota bacterium]
MLTSMTGFGKGEAKNRYAKVCIEIKSLNHKYFDMMARLPVGFYVFEDRIKSGIQKQISRGRINIALEYEDFTKSGANACVDMPAARRYTQLLRELKKSLNIAGDVTLQQIMSLPGILVYKQAKSGVEHVWPLIKQALDNAIRHLMVSKHEEGKILKKQLVSVSSEIAKSIKSIKRFSEELKKQYKNKLAGNIKALTGNKKVYNPERLEEEAAIFIRNGDIAEEICRIEAHIKAFKKALSNQKELGRHLDFIAQELSREANTIGAKANSFKIAKETIKIKSMVEKIREQTQNVE